MSLVEIFFKPFGWPSKCFIKISYISSVSKKYRVAAYLRNFFLELINFFLAIAINIFTYSLPIDELAIDFGLASKGVFGHTTSIFIVHILNLVSESHHIHLQQLISHVDIYANETNSKMAKVEFEMEPGIFSMF